MDEETIAFFGIAIAVIMVCEIVQTFLIMFAY